MGSRIKQGQEPTTFRLLPLEMSKTESLVVDCIYKHNRTITETAYIARISQGRVRQVLWHITDRIVKDEQ